MSLRVEFAVDFPDEFKDSVAATVREYGPYYCRTVDHVTVHFGDDEEADASINILTRYRHAHIFLSAKFATCDEPTREEIINHELAHIPLEPVFAVIGTMMKHTQNEQIRQITQEWLMDSIECATEDTARTVMELHRQKRELLKKATKKPAKRKKSGTPT